jgi:hypothetical protein
MQSCDVLVLRRAGDSITLHNAEAAEAGVFGSIQQLYHLLAGLLKAADTGGAYPFDLGGVSGGGALQGLPRPYTPNGAKVSTGMRYFTVCT